MKIGRYWLGCMIVAIVAVACDGGGSSPSAPSSAEATASAAPLSITIGVPVPLTGPEAESGESLARGAQLAVNAAEGIEVKLVLEDDGCDSQQGVNAVNRLVSAGVNIVAGFYCSAPAIASVPILNREHIPTIVAGAQNPDIMAPGYPEVFRIIATTTQEAQAAAMFLDERLNAESVALIHDNTAIQKGLCEEVEANLSDLAVDVPLVTTVAPGTTDFGVAVANVQGANVDAIFNCIYFTEAGLFTRQLLESGYSGDVLNSGASVGPEFIEIAGEETAEAIYYMGIPNLYLLDSGEAFIEEYTAEYGEEPNPYAMYTFDAVNVAMDVVKSVGSTDPDAIIEGLRAYQGTGIIGPISFDDSGELESEAAFVLIVYRDREYLGAP